MVELKATLLAALMLTTSLALASSGDEGAESSIAATPTSEASPASQANKQQLTKTDVSAKANAAHPLGEPRNDLERFYGVYGDPDNPGRDFFVAKAERPAGSDVNIPPGYLMVGAMWGDVAPWYMKSLSDTEFKQQWVSDFQSEPLAVNFELGEDGNAIALAFKTMFADRGRLQRLNDLPAEWQ